MTPRASGSLFAVSAALLLLELYWLRAFAEAEWAHLAAMVVSTALLGFGAGGTVVLVLGDSVIREAPRTGRALLGAFVVLAVLAPPLVRHLPLEPMLLAWRPSAWAWVLAREALVALPFAAGAAFIALRFRLAPHDAPRLYAWNLFGSGAGIAIGLLLTAFRPTRELAATAVVAGAAAFVRELPARRRWPGIAGAIAAGAIAVATADPALSPTKDLAQALRLPGARVLEERPGVPGRWVLFTSPALHVAPGVSLVRPGPVPETRAVFVRGDLAEVLFASRHAEVLRHRVFWAPYVLRPPDSVLVLGRGGALEAGAASLAGAKRIVAVVPDSRTRLALRGALGDFAGLGPRLEIRSGNPRAWLRRDRRRYDLVVLPPPDSAGSAAAGLGSTAENWLLTREGVADALAASSDRGLLAVPRWTQLPPRDLPKLLATAADVLGIADPRPHLALVQGWDAWILCVSRTAFEDVERRRLADFARDHGFDVWLPEPPAASPVHELPGPGLASVIAPALARPRAPLGTGPFVLEPADDDRPFFHHSLDYRRLGEWFRLVRDGTIVPSEWGDLFLGAGLLSAVALGALLILLPAAATRPRAVFRTPPSDLALFATLGFAFIALEIQFIHQGARLFEAGGPSAALTIAAFLLGSATGAAWLRKRSSPGAPGALAAFAAASLALALAFGLPPILERISAATPFVSGALFLGLAFAVAVPLGVPFPAGLARIGAERPHEVPWLFAVNGWASVVGATAASLLAVVGGFRLLGFATATLYAMAGFLLALRVTRRT